MDIYHRNRRFIFAILICILILAGVISKTSTTNLSPPLEPSCACHLTQAQEERYAFAEVKFLASDTPTKAECLESKPCPLNIRVKEDGLWSPRTEIIGVARYDIQNP